MVSVLVTQPFTYRERSLQVGDWVEMEPVDAATKARAGLVSLLHGNAYQTRDMVAERPSLSFDGIRLPDGRMLRGTDLDGESYSNATEQPVKRRRGRPRKVSE